MKFINTFCWLGMVFCMGMAFPRAAFAQGTPTPFIDPFKAVSDKDPQVRKAAVVALGEKTGLKTVRVLLKALKDKEQAVRGSGR